MTKLTNEQLHYLNMYSVYIEKPKQPLCSLHDVTQCTDEQITHLLATIQQASGCPSQTVTSSFFTRRYGLFISMQFYFLTQYDEIWEGNFNDFYFGVVEEFGNQTISMFTSREYWRNVSRETRETTIRHILHEQCAPFIQQIQRVSNLAALTHWENFFGYLLWHYHVLLEQEDTHAQAIVDLNILQSDAVWEGIADHSLFASYTRGLLPSDLLNTTVRTTCCFSKDVPGLMQCGFCPLKKAKSKRK